MADPVVGITNGVPTSGTGTITTLGQTLLDGANATLGVTTGTAVTTSASGTIQQYLRGIVSLLVSGITVTSHAVTNAGTFAVQVTSTVSTAVTNAGTFAVQATLTAGSLILGKVGIDQTTPGTTNKVSIGTDGTVTIANVNGNGSAFQANSAPVTQAPTSFRVAVAPTVTASAYTAGNVLGGIMTFANALLGTPNASPTKWSAILESINVKFKAAAVTGEIDVAIFTALPAGGTYTDKTAPTANVADQAKLVGIYALPTPLSTLGTMTCYNLDGIGAAIDGASTSLFAVVTVKGTPTPASTTDVIVELGVLQG